MLDIYFETEYGKLCELVDGGAFEKFVLETEFGTVQNMFIKRPVPFLLNATQYYDIVTPYGYGGPIIQNASDKERLLKEYAQAFAKYCSDNNIVCEFVRYHPIFRNYADFETVYETVFSRHTVGTNLKDYADPVQSEFSKTARREVRKAGAAGIVCTIILNPDNLDVFRKLYEETMVRNNAGDMYFFPDEYYQMLTTTLKNGVLEIQAQYEGETVASEIYFITGKVMHAHLLGSNQKFLDVDGGAILEATAARWGKENGFAYIHHGGGRSSAEDDPLYKYKKKFGKNTEFDFYIGKKIWNPEIYNQLVALRKEKGEITNPEYFPKYRG